MQLKHNTNLLHPLYIKFSLSVFDAAVANLRDAQALCHILLSIVA